MIDKIPYTVHSNCLIYTVDIESLYTNIPNSLGLTAIEYWLSKFPTFTEYPSNFIISSIKFILENNFFSYNKVIYKQLNGVAMGSNFAPKYANLVVGYIEAQLMNCSEINSSSKEHLKKNYFRFIDDILVFWHGNNLDPFDIVLKKLNSFDKNLKFICSNGRKVNNFLDINFVIYENQIKRDIYYKKTNNHSYIPFCSNISKKIKVNVPFVLFQRICRIVSDEKWKTFRIKEMYQILRKHNYPISLLNNAIIKSLNSKLIIPKIENKYKSVVPFITSAQDKFYQENIFPLKYLYEKNHNIQIFKIQKRQTDFLSFLNKSNNISSEHKVTKCEMKSCLLCYNLKQYFGSFKIKDCNIKLNNNASCNTSYVIYCLFCVNCSQFYIGKSQTTLKKRFNLHRFHLRQAEEDPTYSLPLYKHLISCSSSEFGVTVIYVEHEKEPLKLLLSEQYFIKLLKPSLNVL